MFGFVFVAGVVVVAVVVSDTMRALASLLTTFITATTTPMTTGTGVDLCEIWYMHRFRGVRLESECA